MSEDAHVYDLVRAAAPPRYRIRDELDTCAVTGRKHTHHIVMGGPGSRKDDIGLILTVCPNAPASRCAGHHKPLKLQMSLTNRLGLLLDLAVLVPPPFQSEDFARWCCQATIALLARDAVVLRGNPPLGPGIFAVFTPVIPGLEDLPRMSEHIVAGHLPVRTRALPSVVAADGEEVDVLLVIYEIDRLGPYRVVAKGKKLGALVGFTFRQPAVIRALGLAPNSRELSSYLMYEPFQQAWTKEVQPCQTVTVCEGGGAIYRHPRVNVTLWLDQYVKHIYPDWVRQGLALHDLATIAAENGGAQQLPQGAPPTALAPGRSTVQAKRPPLALPAPAQSDKPKRMQLALRPSAPAINVNHPLLALLAPAPAVKVNRPLLALPAPAVKAKRAAKALPAPAPAVKVNCSLLALPAPAVKAKRAAKALLAVAVDPKHVPIDLPVQKVQKTVNSQGLPMGIAGPATVHVPTGDSSTTSTIIDLTTDGDTLKTRKRKRSLVGPKPSVELTIDLEETGPRRRRRRRLHATMKIDGKGTAQDPYVL